ncbi:hypothetical protein PHLCEN_2v7976 [Hermanssonia centrifuga]|uniref:Mediator of RNA polymerase II transcription subunit 17 n=1 Tax=Hermanssonia centrifuga TaxID=98765 RepID=A0A2R6NV10_9APHY|nr:hypothetical protein PHLCEN_2v7976 [Hermanssonia centrifuga]
MGITSLNILHDSPEDPTSKVGENLRRIFIERGHDFFDKQHRGAELDEGEEEPQKEATDRVQPMTPEQLFKMRVEVLPQLQDLLALLLSTPTPTSILGLSQPTQPSPISNEPPILKATVVNKPPPIQSVHAFNTELVVGGKDRGLRKAAELFKSAAESVEQSRARGEQYWVDALKIRRGNWGLIPAPLPPGSAIGRGADKTCKDFLVSFSLEESPIAFRRRAIGRVPTFDTTASVLEYPLRQQTRLQVSINITNPDGNQHTFKNHLRLQDKSFLEGSLRAAQAEVVEQEIFFALIKEGSSLPTASARVSERLVAIEVAQATEVRFELVSTTPAQKLLSNLLIVTAKIDSDVEDVPPETSDSICDLIFSALHLLLLRAHAHVRTQRLGAPGVIRPGPAPVVEPPPILQPIVDLLQYRAFCARIHAEIGKMDSGLREAGIPTKLRLNPVGENGEQLVSMLTVVASPQRIGGEAILRIANR